jgi:Zn-dependent peptidase ImmA (M78 family)
VYWDHASYFFTEPSVKVEFIAYRQSGNLSVRESDRLKNKVEIELENRVEILELLGQADGTKIPLKTFDINKQEDTEEAAGELRNCWGLGLEPICNVTETLERNSICVINMEADDDFDGVSARVYDNADKLKTVALVTRRNVDVVKQRLNLTHELGHLLMKVNNALNEEDVAFRFGKAFLAPAKRIYEDIGKKRSLIQIDELMSLKKRYGLSIQALLVRLYELDIITKTHCNDWYSMIYKWGWRNHEPEDWQNETSDWLQNQVIRLFSEGIIDKNTVKRIIGEDAEFDFPSSVVQKRQFLKLPLEKRKKILEEQAAKVIDKYNEVKEEFDGGDVIEY